MASQAGSVRPPSIEVSTWRPPSSGKTRSSSKAVAQPPSDPILRNALRYTISAREYALLHKYILSRSRVMRRRAPTVASIENYMDGTTKAEKEALAVSRGKGKKGLGKESQKGLGPSSGPRGSGRDTYNTRAVRHALRVFMATGLGMSLHDFLLSKLKRQKVYDAGTQTRNWFWNSPNFRLSLSLSTILLLYRLLFRFLGRLRLQLLDPAAEPYRDRNPRISQTLTSPYAPAVGASLAGLTLGLYPSDQLRVSVATYSLFRALEFSWNMLEDDGTVWAWKARPGGKGSVKRERPWWWGSWMLQPFAFGQLLHAVVFDRDCSPVQYVDFIWKSTSTYLHSPPKGLPPGTKWPTPWEVADSLATMAKMNWPPFVSPMLFPNQETLPHGLSSLAPMTSQAHPLITSLSCATLHPTDPSCLRTYLTFWVRSFPRLGRYFFIFYSVLLLPRYKLLYNSPISVLSRLFAQSLRLTTFVAGSISTAWASICLFQNYLPRGLLPQQRFFLGGFLAGLWAFIERRGGRSVFLYSARTSLDSLWKVGVKRRWWRAMKGGDVWVLVAALAVTGVVYEREALAIREKNWRRGMSWVRGEGWRDWEMEADDECDDDGEGDEGRNG